MSSPSIAQGGAAFTSGGTFITFELVLLLPRLRAPPVIVRAPVPLL